MQSNKTIGQLFFNQATKRGENTAMRFKQCRTEYQSMSWTELAALVKEMAFGLAVLSPVGSSRVDLQACKLEYSIVSPK